MSECERERERADVSDGERKECYKLSVLVWMCITLCEGKMEMWRSGKYRKPTKKAAIVFNQPGTLGISLAGARVPDPT